MRPTRSDVVLIWSASGKPSELVRLAARAAFLAHEVDVQLEKSGAGYVITVTELRGELVVSEVVLHVTVGEIEEPHRLGLLLIWTESILLDAARWRRRSDAAIAVALRDAAVRLGLPDG